MLEFSHHGARRRCAGRQLPVVPVRFAAAVAVGHPQAKWLWFQAGLLVGLLSQVWYVKRWFPAFEQAQR